MKYLLILSTLIASIFSIQGCSDKPSAKQQSPLSATDYHKIDFIKFISERKNDTVDFYEGFLLDKEFVSVFEHGEFYKNDVNEFLNAGHFTYPQVAVCICAMQKLNVHDYVKLCNIILALYDDNKVPEGLLQDAISPDFLHGLIIIDNYKEADVVALLKNIENDKKITNKDFRAGLPDILSGKSSRELKKFYDGNQSG